MNEQLVYLHTFFLQHNIINRDISKAFSIHFQSLNKNSENRADMTTSGLPIKFGN